MRNFACGGLWSVARLHAAGLCDSPLCTACGCIADATHEVWECEADAWFRESWNDPQLFQAVGDAPPSYGKSRLLVETPAPRSLGLPIMPRIISVNCEHATVSFSGISGVDGSLFEGSYRDLARGGGQSRVTPQMAKLSSTRCTDRCQGTGTRSLGRSSIPFLFFAARHSALFFSH